jgi:Uma2 family endonuclease
MPARSGKFQGMEALLQTQRKHWTYEEYYRLNDEQRYEIFNGELSMAPAPDTWHQDWLGALHLLIAPYVRKGKLGRVFVAPVDVVLDSSNVVQPDLVFVAQPNCGIIEKRAIFGTPDVVVEFISPSSVRRDRYLKKALYARFGVKEYWIGDPANKSLEVLRLEDGVYQPFCSAEERGRITSSVVPGFEFDLSELE